MSRTVLGAVDHSEVERALESGTSMDYPALTVNITSGHVSTTESEGLGVGLKDIASQMVVTEITSDGQCATQGVRIGMAIVGVNGVPLSKCLEDPSDVGEFSQFMHVAQRPFKLNFNALPAKRSAPAKTKSGFFEPGPMTCMESCCGVTLRPKSNFANWMLAPESGPTQASCFTSCCLCLSSTPPRTEGGIEKVPQLKALAGTSVQSGDHATSGTIQTLKWSKYDPKSHTLLLSVFGGASDPDALGTWSEPDTCLWRFLIPLARSCDYLYLFKFSEDNRRLDIDVKVNCCCCLPCVPAWCNLPAACFGEHGAYQVDGSTDGSRWVRSKNGKKYYDLIVVTGSDGTPNENFAEHFAYPPDTMLLSR